MSIHVSNDFEIEVKGNKTQLTREEAYKLYSELEDKLFTVEYNKNTKHIYNESHIGKQMMFNFENDAFQDPFHYTKASNRIE